ncbi:MAG: H4MPT-linked C1 transfer pathway protein [Planctomycetes bacterium]|nr:H4MPT-linked C1 transfer pathway protein [Planctomycetota bacterium]
MTERSAGWLGLDIGGANLKAADGCGYAASRPFPLWSHPEQLADELRSLIAAAPASHRLAVTMTGELADCFESKAAGVRFILDAVDEAAGGRDTRVYLASGEFATPAAARDTPLSAAASNWRALAEFCLRYVGDSPALLLDVGSTTTDIIPLLSGRVAAAGGTDTERLLAGELLYAGVSRTPVCAVVDSLPYRGRDCSIARELFATLRDVYLLLGDLPEDPQDANTADGRPATRAAARSRLARMICADPAEFTLDDAVRAAEVIARRHREMTAAALRQVLAVMRQAPATIITAGEGEFLARRLIATECSAGEVIALSRKIGDLASRCAPAHAVAVLASRAP